MKSILCERAALEVLALRRQVAVLNRKRPCPRLNRLDWFFRTILRRGWSRWAEVLVVVKPETVVGWRRAGLRLRWRWRSRPRGGRPKITGGVRVLVRRLAEEDPDWSAPKIHGELLKGDSGKRRLAFLRNHREAIVAFDFFTVPTVTFKLLYCFFVMEYGRREIPLQPLCRHLAVAGIGGGDNVHRAARLADRGHPRNPVA